MTLFFSLTNFLKDYEARKYINQKVEVVVSYHYLVLKLVYSCFLLCTIMIFTFAEFKQSGTTTNVYLKKLEEALEVHFLILSLARFLHFFSLLYCLSCTGSYLHIVIFYKHLFIFRY